MANRSPEERKLDKQLLKAAGRGDIPEMEKLLAAGADIEARSSGMLALNHTPLHRAVWNKQLAAARWLIERGAKVDVRGVLETTPLLDAVEFKDAAMVKMLIEHGADISLRGHDGRNATALATRKADKAVISVLGAYDRQKRQERAREREELIRRITARNAELENTQAPPNPDMVAVFRVVGDRTLQEIFNFEGRERITFVRKEQDGPVEAVTRQNFSDIADKKSIRAAFAVYAARGGKIPEHEIFEDGIDKPRIQAPKQRGGMT